MFKNSRADYKNLTIAQAKEKGYDMVALKYDGIWGRLVGDGHKLVVFSQNDQVKFECPYPDKSVPMYFEVIGEFMYGSNWAEKYGLVGNFYAFDCYVVKGLPITTMNYLHRVDEMVKITDRLQLPWVRKAKMADVSYADRWWDTYVAEDGEYSGAFEGIVFAKGRARGLDFARLKKELTIDYRVLGVVEGKGRLTGSAGAIVCEIRNSPPMLVGGGLTDQQRSWLWSNRTLLTTGDFIIEVKGNRLFPSGKLRHPNFLRFRDDKMTPFYSRVVENFPSK